MHCKNGYRQKATGDIGVTLEQKKENIKSPVEEQSMSDSGTYDSDVWSESLIRSTHDNYLFAGGGGRMAGVRAHPDRLFVIRRGDLLDGYE